MTHSERPLKRVRVRPCPSCPFRRDCPSGLWAPEEYAKLPDYDGDIGEQVQHEGAQGVFHCHSTPERLCSGWVGTFGASNLLALRLHGHRLHPSVWSYRTTVPLFRSGQEAAAHGMRDIEAPNQDARETAEKIVKIRPDVRLG